MGGSVSSGQNNDELVDNLVEGGLIRSNTIERVFRCIDRGLFFLPDSRDRAYRDLAWRERNIHISAPCVYTKVLENLELSENQSFLNIGSGTGYLSSMVGLIIGANGINHNIEIHNELIAHAKDRINQLIKTSISFDEFDFCLPRFIHGDCMNLKISSDMMLYDRIYVGACVNQEQEQFFINFLKIGGLLVMPSNDSLVKIKKIDENCISKNTIMNVSFASLITSQIEKSHPNIPFSMPRNNPFSLQEICRFKIRQTIRKSIENSIPDYYDIKREKSTFNTKKEKFKDFDSYFDECLDEDDNETDFVNNNNEIERTNYPITRFERIFSPNNDFSSNSFEHQIRLMIYGHLFEPNNNALQTAVNNNIDSETDESVVEYNDNNDEDLNDNNSNRSFLNDFNLSSSDDNEIDDDDKSEADLFELFAENCRKAESRESTVELNFPQISKSLESNNESPESELSDDGINLDSESASSSISKSSNKLPIIRRKRNVSSGYSTSYSSSNDHSLSLTDIVEYPNQEDENKENNNIKNIGNNKKSNKFKTNLLRTRILTLPVSKAMREFLLYYREI